MKQGMLLSLASLIAIGLLTSCQQHTEATFNCPDMVAGCQVEGLHLSSKQPPQIMKPFELNLQLGDDVDEVYASFAMEGMDMGLNRYKLIKTSEGVWRAEVTLPVCVRGRADWMMQIEAETLLGQQRYMVSFQTN